MKLSEMRDVSGHVFYSAARIGPATALEPSNHPGYWRSRMIEFFQYAAGNTTEWGQATPADTNMWEPARLPMPQEFLIKRLGILPAPGFPMELAAAVLSDSSLEFYLDQKCMWRLPAWAMLVAGDTPELAKLEGFVYQWGHVQPDMPIHILQQQSFSARLSLPEIPPDHAGFKLWVLLEGQLVRAIQ